MATKDKKPEKDSRYDKVDIKLKSELKQGVVKEDVILEQKKNVIGSSGGLPSTYTKIRLNSGAIKETFGERYGPATNG